MEDLVFFQNFCKIRIKWLVLVMILIALAVVSFQSLILLAGGETPSFLSSSIVIDVKGTSSRVRVKTVADVFMSSDSKNVEPLSLVNGRGEMGRSEEKTELADNDFNSDEDFVIKDHLSMHNKRIVVPAKLNKHSGSVISPKRVSGSEPGVLKNKSGGEGRGSLLFASMNVTNQISSLVPETSVRVYNYSEFSTAEHKLHRNVSNPSGVVLNDLSPFLQKKGAKFSSNAKMGLLKDVTTTPSNHSQNSFELPLQNARNVCTHSVSEMNRQLLKNIISPNAMSPRWPSAVDQQILIAKAKIGNALLERNVKELYAPVFRNISMFSRSYELMEQMLKVYIYKEGKIPIFHKPQLDGIYASEGWFMKLMEGSTHFRVDDPQQAHLFYMPFSSSILRFTLAPGLHNKRKLVKYLKDYIDIIAAKYPFWNRTGGADHFLAACHDWAPYMTRHHMAQTIRALCNADISEGFILGKDVSLPTTNVPLELVEDFGSKPANKRPMIAFFAGGSHGYLREILVKLWEDKDPLLKIFKSSSHRSLNKMVYAQHMKNSKYCICPRGYQAFSPRIVEAIFYECVPVIIADNFVPPFFEVLNWEAFSVFVEEKDIPRLKEILESIPTVRYLSLQKGVRMVRMHFLWNTPPVKYDMFHMILHSVWFSRLNRA